MGAEALKSGILSQHNCADLVKADTTAKATKSAGSAHSASIHEHKTAGKKLANGCYDGEHLYMTPAEKGKLWLQKNIGQIARSVAKMFIQDPRKMKHANNRSSAMAQLIMSSPEAMKAIKKEVYASLGSIKRRAFDTMSAEEMMTYYGKLKSYDATVFNAEKILNKAVRTGVSEQTIKEFCRKNLNQTINSDVSNIKNLKGIIKNLGVAALNKPDIAKSVEYAEKDGSSDIKKYLTTDGQLKTEDLHKKYADTARNCNYSVIDVADNYKDYKKRNNIFATNNDKNKKFKKFSLLSNWLTIKDREKEEII